MSIIKTHMRSVFKLLSCMAIAVLLMVSNGAQAQEGADFGEATEKASSDTKKFFSYFTDWVMLSHIHRSGENAAQVDNLFNAFLKDYASNPILQDILDAFNTGELGLSAEGFFQQTGIRVYFVGNIDISESDSRFEPVLSLLNESLNAKIQTPSAPYIIVTNNLSGNNDAGYKITTVVRYSDEIKAGKYNLDKSDSSNPFMASLNPSASRRNDAGNQIKEAMMDGLATLSANVKENYLPNLMIAYRDKLYKSGESIEVAVTKNGTITLEALNKELLAPTRTVEWSISPDNDQASRAIVDGNKLTFPTETGGEFAILASAGSDEVNVTLKIQGLGQDLKDFLKKLLLEALKPRLEAAIQQQSTLKGDSTEASSSVVTNIKNVENANFPLEGAGQELTVLQEPTVLSDTSVFSQSEVRTNAFKSLRRKKNLVKRLQKVYQLVSYINKVLAENDQEVKDLVDALVENSGELLAQFVITGLNKNDSTAMKDIVANFLDDNLGELAGTSGESAFATFLEPIEAPRGLPSGYNQGDNYYISPLVPLEDREQIIANIAAYHATQQTPTFVVINYSQDVSMESYLARAPTGAPKGLASGQDYVVINYVNIPGSVKEMILTDDDEVVTVNEEGQLEFTSTSSATSSIKEFKRLIGLMICAYKDGETTPVWDWPTSNPIFVPGRLTLFDGNEYRILQVKKHSGFQNGAFSKEPWVVQEIGDIVELRFEAENNDWITVQLYKSDQEAFLNLLKGVGFEQNFTNWLSKIKSETDNDKVEEMIEDVPSCALEKIEKNEDRIYLIKKVLNNFSYFQSLSYWDQFSENHILKLIEDIDPSKITDFHTKIRVEQYGENSLLAEILYQFDDLEFILSDGNNQRLMDVFTSQVLNNKLPDLDALQTAMEEDELLYLYAGNQTSAGNSTTLYSSALLKNGSVKITVGDWHANNWNANTEVSYTYKPLEDWIVLYPLKNIENIGYKAGQPYVVPAIVLHYLITEEYNEAVRTAIYTSIDIASFAIGVGAISSGVKGWKLAVAIIETVSAATSISLEVFEDDLIENGWTEEEINDLRVATAVMELVGVGVLEGPKLVSRLQNVGSRLAGKLDDLGSYSSKLKPAVKERLQKLKEFLAKYLDNITSTRFIARSGSELRTYLNGLDNIPNSISYNGDFIKSVRNDLPPGANTDPKIIDDYATQNLDHRYSKVGESGYYVSKTDDGNKIEMGFNSGNDITKYNRYKFEDVTVDNMLDLRDDLVRKQLGVTEDLIKKLGDNKYDFTHELGSWAKDKYKGIIYPGAQGGDYTNIIIFKQIDVDDALRGIASNPIN